MIRKIIANLGNIKTSILGLALLLTTLGAALAAWVDGDPLTNANWPAVAAAFSGLVAQLVLIFGARDPE